MLFISFDGIAYTVPVNPKDLTISQSASNSNIDIVGIGKATRKGDPGLRTMKLQSFFPNPKSPFYMNVSASTYIEFIEKIWHTDNINNKVAHISSHGIKNDIAGKELDMYFVIEKFDYTYQGGDFDTNYTLSIKEYRPYGVKIIETNFTEGMQSARTPSTVKENVPGLMEDTQPTTEAKTYKVSSGDSLWTIAKRATGDGNNWRALYEANKDVIGSNPNKISAGTTLTLPENWNSPTTSVNTNTSAKLKVSSVNKKTTLNNSTVSTQTDTVKQTVQTAVTGGLASSDDYFENNKRIIELKSLQDATKNHISELNKLADKLTSVEILDNAAGEKINIQKDISDIQNMYNNAVKKSANQNLSDAERAQAIREIRTAELRLYNKRIESATKRYEEIQNAPARKLFGS